MTILSKSKWKKKLGWAVLKAVANKKQKNYRKNADSSIDL